VALPRFGTLDFWFRPKGFESERAYVRLGALLLKRYVPTGGDLVMRRLRRHHPEQRWVTCSEQSLRLYERRTRLNELIHLGGFTGFGILAGYKFAAGSLAVPGLTAALALDLIFGFWPVILQRYNRLRLYRAIAARAQQRARQAQRGA
jgi:Glycosyl-4,4'-diaponeurosporenoate acyltransferase